MGVVLENSTLELFLAVVGLELVLLLVYFKKKFSYWKTRDVPHPEPRFPCGNLTSAVLRQKTLGICVQDIYYQMKKQGKKFCGVYMFTRPIFVPIDPELVKLVMTKDFGSFHDRGMYFDEEVDPLSCHLFAIEGQQWRNLRTKLTPTFTSGKMKMMFHTFVGSSQELGLILDRVSVNKEALDIKDLAARFTTDVIGSCAFGLECNSLKNPEAEFRKYGKKIFELNLFDGFKNVIAMTNPNLMRTFKLAMNKKDVTKFFLNAIKETVEYRESNKVDRKDMMNLLLKIKNNEAIDDDKKPVDQTGLTFNQLAAQCYVFFIGGFETSSTTMTFLLFEISQNQTIQDKLRKEIREVLAKHSGQVTYEAVMEMTYMDKVINETLRKYPPVPFLNRTANEDWRIPGTNIVLEKGTAILISNYGMQMDPEYFPKPEVFDPERFSEGNKTWHPYCYLPFGEGPRNCIGMRFGLLQTKVGLTAFLKDHRFHLHPKTTTPIHFDVNSLILSHNDGIWLQTSKV